MRQTAAVHVSAQRFPRQLLHTLAKKWLSQRLRDSIKFWIDRDFRERREWEIDRRVGEEVFRLTGGKIVAGPFAGLSYVSSGRGSCIGPKLLGCYEKELHPIIERVIAPPQDHKYLRIINIGAGEGYYAVGLAWKIPEAQVICFDSDVQNQEQARKLAELNGVQGRVDVRGHCDETALSLALNDYGNTLIICDIEGAELDVLRPDKVLGLKRAEILVELHDLLRPGCASGIRSRFEPTHRIDVIRTRRRRPCDAPQQCHLGRRQCRAFLNERRGFWPMNFFWMRPITVADEES